MPYTAGDQPVRVLNIDGECPVCKLNYWHRNAVVNPNSQLFQCLNCGGVFTAIELWNYAFRKKTKTKRKESHGEEARREEEDGA